MDTKNHITKVRGLVEILQFAYGGKVDQKCDKVWLKLDKNMIKYDTHHLIDVLCTYLSGFYKACAENMHISTNIEPKIYIKAWLILSSKVLRCDKGGEGLRQ